MASFPGQGAVGAGGREGVTENEESRDEEDLGEEEGDNAPGDVEEEHRVWTENAPFLYDVVMCHSFEWPSLTVSWFYPTGSSANENHVVLGTHTSGEEKNYLMLATVSLPLTPGTAATNSASAASTTVTDCISIYRKIPHMGEVNRARSMPQRPSIVATKSPSPEVFLFDTSSNPTSTEFDPLMSLTGLEKEGYGITWNQKREGHIISCSGDNTVCLWDICSGQANNKTLPPLRRFAHHTDYVEEVDWNPFNENIFASVSDDKNIIIWDARLSTPARTVSRVHSGEIYGLAYNTFQEHIFATSSSDKTVAIWDARNLSSKQHELQGHSDEVFQVVWCPSEEHVLASCSSDRHVNVWDLRRIGDEQSAEDAEDGPPELMFVHGGHQSRVLEFSWSKTCPFLAASIAEQNDLQIWKMAQNIQGEEDTRGVADSELE
ncbi:retinoblastoma binding protein 4 [Pelomyxa schiedti]|nr:retinoblastoma binding protein 4 [Pelomyxa schiedti]